MIVLPATTQTPESKLESIKSRLKKLNLSEVALIRKCGPVADLRKSTREVKVNAVDCSTDLVSIDRNRSQRYTTTPQENVGVELTTFSCSRPPLFPKPKLSIYSASLRENVTSPKVKIDTLQKDLNLKRNGRDRLCLYSDLKEDNAASAESNKNKCPLPCLDCRDFSKVDQHAANYDRRHVSSIANLADDLCNPFESKVDKARAIFTWLHHNIAYDTKSFFQNNVRHQTPEVTLRTGISVCQGYTELFEKLANHAGLEAIVISGHGKGYGYKPGSCDGVFQLKNHAWNAVKLDCGKWQLIDPCWGAGHVDNNETYVKLFKPTAFTSSPETFRKKHFPFHPKYQFCATELSWEEYVMMEEQPMIYSEFINKGFSEVTIQPCTRTIKPKPTKFVITSKCPHTLIPPEDRYVVLLNVDGIRTPFQVDSRGTTWTCETTAIRESSVVQVDLLEKLGSRNAKGISVNEYVRTAQNYGYSLCTLCSWNVKE